MKYAKDYAGYGNESLYRMCKDKPLHNDLDIVKSKIWIIGRAYSAAIERGAGKFFDENNAASIIMRSNIDDHLTRLKAIRRPSQSNLDELLTAHKDLTDSFYESTKIRKRSLASKYLHFHAPRAVFIYDSIADKNIKTLLASHKQKFTLQGGYDDQYEAFVLRCIYYRDNIYEKEISAGATPRKLDGMLLLTEN
jgi:hypothetical protein